jgi:hypothetical protein
MDNDSVIYAMIAVFLALGESVGEHVLQRAGNRIRDLIADEVVGPETSEILETVLVGIDAATNRPPAWGVFEQLATLH